MRYAEICVACTIFFASPSPKHSLYSLKSRLIYHSLYKKDGHGAKNGRNTACTSCLSLYKILNKFTVLESSKKRYCNYCINIFEKKKV